MTDSPVPPDIGQAWARHAMLMEAVHSTAIEHPRDCDCLTCEASRGDRDALGELMLATRHAQAENDRTRRGDDQ